MPVDSVFLRRLRVLGTIEGVSTLVLFFVAMPLKYLAGMPLAVTIAGSIHGVLFIGLVSMFLIGADRVPIPRGLVVVGLLAAVVPFGPFVIDGRLARLDVEMSEAG